jgi:hypothetical protein
MSTLSAKRIKEALKGAGKVGHIEEAFTLAGLPIVLQSLTQDDYEAIHQEVIEKDDLAYLYALRTEHLARSTVELGDLDLRPFAFVEVEEDIVDPTNGVTKQVVNVERHAYLRDHVFKEWSREALDAAYRKFLDVEAKSERHATAGIVFETTQETAGEKYRRLAGELRELEAEVPTELANRVLLDHGYLRRSTEAEMTAASDRLRRQDVPDPGPPDPGPRVPTPEEIMQARRPLNQGPSVVANVPAPPVAPPVVAARPPRMPPEGVLSHRSAQYAQIEQEAGLELGNDLGNQVVPANLPVRAATEMKPVLRPDPVTAARVIDAPPGGGINPRYRPPPRM